MKTRDGGSAERFELVVGALETCESFNSSLMRKTAVDVSPPILLQILALFANSLSHSISVVGAGLSHRLASEIWPSCHKISGTAELVGFKSLGDFARELSHELRVNADLNVGAVESYLAQAHQVLTAITESFPDRDSFLPKI